ALCEQYVGFRQRDVPHQPLRAVLLFARVHTHTHCHRIGQTAGDPVSSEAEDVHRSGRRVYHLHLAHGQLFLAATRYLPETLHLCLQ
ncbi:Uncharacterized protein DAT39_001319, partial [Clarias magur]